MSNEDEKQEERGFKVEDRRRFSETGETRPEQQESPPAKAGTSTDEAMSEVPPHPAARSPEQRTDRPPPLEMNFSTFVFSLSTQALAHLGEIPNPIDNQTAVDLGAAKQLIDILGILKDKTKGNLDQAESALLDNMLYDLRLKYVERVRQRS